MRIVQTFWSSNKDLIQNSFGWLSPQYHIMGWALSCLKLKEHYDDLHLYTDANGTAILIDYLGLPYKTVTVCHDSINHYSQNLWAMSKIKTYAAQEEPFIHVDGDVFIWNRFSPDLENANLIAQNLETERGFYKGLMDEVKGNIKNIPDYLEKELAKESISSYNMGLFGGKDIIFIKKYCESALNLIHNNYTPDGQHEVPPNFNLLFEQILFHALTSLDNKTVDCFFTEKYEADGYTIGDFCDFTIVPNKLTYLHLIGNHKRNGYICDLMSRMLFKEYPEYFYKIIALFKNEHVHFEKKIMDVLPLSLSDSISIEQDKNNKFDFFPYHRTQRAILKENENATLNDISTFVKNSASETIKDVFQFENQINSIIDKWANIPGKELHETERIGISYFDFFFKTREDQLKTVFVRHPHLEVIEESYDWDNDTKKIVNPYLMNNSDEALGLVYRPQLFFKGYSEVIVDEISYNILAVLEEPTTFRELLPYITNCFTGNEGNDSIIYDLTLIKLRYLFFNQCIFIKE